MSGYGVSVSICKGREEGGNGEKKISGNEGQNLLTTARSTERVGDALWGRGGPRESPREAVVIRKGEQGDREERSFKGRSCTLGITGGGD